MNIEDPKARQLNYFGQRTTPFITIMPLPDHTLSMFAQDNFRHALKPRRWTMDKVIIVQA